MGGFGLPDRAPDRPPRRLLTVAEAQEANVPSGSSVPRRKVSRTDQACGRTAIWHVLDVGSTPTTSTKKPGPQNGVPVFWCTRQVWESKSQKCVSRKHNLAVWPAYGSFSLTDNLWFHMPIQRLANSESEPDNCRLNSLEASNAIPSVEPRLLVPGIKIHAADLGSGILAALHNKSSGKPRDHVKKTLIYRRENS